MEIPYLSTTLIKNWPICQLRALQSHLIRVEEGDGDWGSLPTRFGTIVHDVAEEMHKLDMEGKTADPLEMFDKLWRSSHLADFDYYEFGRSSIAEFIDRTLFHREGVTIATEFGFILDLVDMVVVPTEGLSRDEFLAECKKITDRGGIPVASKIDRVDRISKTKLEVYDYKTNRQPFTRSEVDNSEQLALYHMAAQAMWPEVKEIRCVFDMLRHGRFPTVFDQDRLDTIHAFIINIWYQIQEADYPVPELNQYCGWCEYKEKCPVYAEALAGDLTHPYAPGDDMSTEELWKIYQDLKAVSKHADYRAKEFAQTIQARLVKDNGGKPLPLNGEKEIYLQLNPRYEYPIEDVYAVLKKHKAVSLLTRCAKVSKPNLERALRGRVKLKEQISPLLKKSFASPTLRTRKLNDNTEEEEDETED